MHGIDETTLGVLIKFRRAVERSVAAVGIAATVAYVRKKYRIRKESAAPFCVLAADGPFPNEASYVRKINKRLRRTPGSGRRALKRKRVRALPAPAVLFDDEEKNHYLIPYRGDNGKGMYLAPLGYRRNRGRRGRAPTYHGIKKMVKGMIDDATVLKKQHRDYQVTFHNVTAADNVCEWEEFFVGRRDSLDTEWQSVDLLEMATTILGTEIEALKETDEDLTTIGSVGLTTISETRSRHFRNNYHTPCWFEAFFVSPKESLASANFPKQSMIDGLADMGVTTEANGPQTLDQWIHFSPANSRVFKEFWTVTAHTKKLLNPGDTADLNLFLGQYTYYPEVFDQSANNIIIAGLTHGVMYRIYGVVGHRSDVLTSVGRVACGLDYEKRIEYRLGTADVGSFTSYDTVSSVYTAIGATGVVDIDDDALEVGVES